MTSRAWDVRPSQSFACSLLQVAALNEDTADAALGNVTGSNAVNVFLGIGLPWTVAAIYWKLTCDRPYPAASVGFAEGVIVFCCCAVICLFTLVSGLLSCGKIVDAYLLLSCAPLPAYRKQQASPSAYTQP